MVQEEKSQNLQQSTRRHIQEIVGNLHSHRLGNLNSSIMFLYELASLHNVRYFILNIKAEYSSETSTNFYNTTRRHVADDRNNDPYYIQCSNSAFNYICDKHLCL